MDTEKQRQPLQDLRLVVTRRAALPGRRAYDPAEEITLQQLMLVQIISSSSYPDPENTTVPHMGVSSRLGPCRVSGQELQV